MDVTSVYTNIFGAISPMLIVGGMLALTISLITMLINMLIGSATGKGFTIGIR